MADINLLPEIARQVRRDILRMVHAVNSGHPGGSLGCADYLTALYFHYMKHDPSNFTGHGNGEDVFVMSNGHISPVFYSALARSGYFPTEEIATFRKFNTRLQGHPTTHEGLPGVRVATGSFRTRIECGNRVCHAKEVRQRQQHRMGVDRRWRIARRPNLGSGYVCGS